MGMKQLRTAVCGLGRIGWQYHLPKLAAHPGFTITAVADPMPERLAEAEAVYGAAGYGSFEELLEREAGRLDLAVIASPTIFHKPQALEAFACGLDVFLDKPVALDLMQTDEILEAMRRHSRRLMVYQPHRVTSECRAVRAILDGGLLGPIHTIRRACTGYERRNDWQSMLKNGGGMLNNYGAHFIDQLLYVTRSRCSKVYCSLKRVLSLGDAEDVVKILMETDTGILLDLDIDMAAGQPMPLWQILGRDGAATLIEDESGTHFELRYLKESDKLALQHSMAAEGRTYGSSGGLVWAQERVDAAWTDNTYYDHCYSFFALGRPPLVPVEETREVMRVIALCRQAAGR